MKGVVNQFRVRRRAGKMRPKTLHSPLLRSHPSLTEHRAEFDVDGLEVFLRRFRLFLVVFLGPVKAPARHHEGGVGDSEGDERPPDATVLEGLDDRLEPVTSDAHEKDEEQDCSESQTDAEWQCLAQGHRVARQGSDDHPGESARDDDAE